ncbi:MAG: hypothetical protein V2A34_08875, partial [Lentisphaerota bacterium]
KRFRALELWPIKSTPAMDLNYAPLWQLYVHTSNKERVQDELLWGLFRYSREGKSASHVSLFPLYEKTRDDREAQVRKWSVLKGLIGYEQAGTQKSVRVLYFIRFKLKEKKPS